MKRVIADVFILLPDEQTNERTEGSKGSRCQRGSLSSGTTQSELVIPGIPPRPSGHRFPPRSLSRRPHRSVPRLEDRDFGLEGNLCARKSCAPAISSFGVSRKHNDKCGGSLRGGSSPFVIGVIILEEKSENDPASDFVRSFLRLVGASITSEARLSRQPFFESLWLSFTVPPRSSRN